MKAKWILVTMLALWFLLGLVANRGIAQDTALQEAAAPQAQVGMAFTYQGRLNKGGSLYTGTCDFKFSLYDAAGDGIQVGNTQTIPGVDVADGLFTVAVNSGDEFGSSPFNGEARWLEIQVKCSGDGDYTVLDPRQELTPAPYALALPGLRTKQNATSPNIVGGYWGNGVSGGAVGATISGGGNDSGPNQALADYATIGGGWHNEATDTYSTVSGGQANAADGQSATVAGGQDNFAYVDHATVGGGAGNEVNGEHGTVGGGEGNVANGDHATVAGGYDNYAGGTVATIAGGEYNHATGPHATVGGGQDNFVSGDHATVGGGQDNFVSGDHATVAGGFRAVASHYGEMAYASGSFDWPTKGEAQTSVYVLRNTTTGTAWTELFLDGNSERLTIASGRTVVFHILIVGRSDGGVSGGYWCRGLIENVGGNTNLVAGSTCYWQSEDDGTWDARSVSDDVNDALLVEVKGNDQTVRWVATVLTAEVAW